MAQQEQPKQQIKCKQCGKVVNSQEELREHEKTHQVQAKQPGGQARGAGGGQGKKSGQ
jgi:hypothetical protein